MRFLFLLALVALTIFPAHLLSAQEEVPKPFNPLVIETDQNNAGLALGFSEQSRVSDAKIVLRDMYRSCISAPSKTLDKGKLKSMCSCTVAQIAENMSQTEIILINDDSKDGIVQRERMVGIAYVPCAQHPIRDMVRQDCLSDMQLVEDVYKPIQFCSCVAEGARTFINKNNQMATFAATKKPETHGDIDSIIEFLTTSRGFERSLETTNRYCMRQQRRMRLNP